MSEQLPGMAALGKRRSKGKQRLASGDSVVEAPKESGSEASRVDASSLRQDEKQRETMIRKKCLRLAGIITAALVVWQVSASFIETNDEKLFKVEKEILTPLEGLMHLLRRADEEIQPDYYSPEELVEEFGPGDSSYSEFFSQPTQKENSFYHERAFSGVNIPTEVRRQWLYWHPFYFFHWETSQKNIVLTQLGFINKDYDPDPGAFKAFLKDHDFNPDVLIYDPKGESMTEAERMRLLEVLFTDPAGHLDAEQFAVIYFRVEHLNVPTTEKEERRALASFETFLDKLRDNRRELDSFNGSRDINGLKEFVDNLANLSQLQLSVQRQSQFGQGGESWWDSHRNEALKRKDPI